ncbi:MAG: MFS transporter [Anaerohalosphaeraceae bacterium]
MDKAVALLSVFGLGMCFSLLGSIGVKLMPRLKIDQGHFGSLISIFMFSCLLGSLVMGITVDKIGYKPVAFFGFIATAICVFILANAKNYATAIVPCLLLGFGAMAMNTVGNTLIPQILFEGKNPAAASNLGNVFFGLGLFLTPLLVSLLFRKTSYEIAVGALGILVLIPTVLVFGAEFPKGNAGFSLASAVALLKEPAALVAALTLLCYISLESSFCNWLAPYGKEVIAKDFPSMASDVVDATAQQMLSLFAVAMMAGRLIASQIGMITEYGSWFISGAAVIMAIVIFAMMRGGAIWTSALAVCAGLAFAPCFPTIVGVTFAKFDPSIYGSLFGIIFAVGLVGGMFVPKAIGNMAKGSSIQQSIKLLLPAVIILIVLALVLGKMKGTV